MLRIVGARGPVGIPGGYRLVAAAPQDLYDYGLCLSRNLPDAGREPSVMGDIRNRGLRGIELDAQASEYLRGVG